MKKIGLLFTTALFISCSEREQGILLKDDLFLETIESANEFLSGIPELDGADINKREKKTLKNGWVIETVEGYNIMDGDILLEDEQIKELEEPEEYVTKAGVIEFGHQAFKVQRWTDGIIPFVIESGHARRSQILTAMEEWSTKTSIRFVPYTNAGQGTYLFFKKGAEENRSFVGCRHNMTKQEIWVSSSNPGVAMHEIGHAIGLIHEHQRSDAASDIIVYENNIKEDWVHWFRPHSFTHYCLNKYNFNSIMGYDSYDCIRSGSRGYSMVKRSDGAPWNKNRSYISTLDIVAVECFYNKLTPVYRYYAYINSRTDDHYYGVEEPEGNSKPVKDINYNYEYLEFFMPANVAGTIPLYRYYNPVTKNHSFYPYPDYTQDAQVGYVFTDKQHGTVELREYKKVSKDSYHYVTSLSEEAWMADYPEKYQFIRQIGWVYPGRGEGRD